MSNLESMIAYIREKSENEAQDYIKEANEKVEALKSEAINEANEQKNLLLEKAKMEADKIYERTIASNELKVRDSILRAKQSIIDKVFEDAKVNLNNLSDEEFKSYLSSKVGSLNLKGSEKVLVPKKYEGIDFGDLKISVEGSDRISSGFLVEGDNSTLNFSFDDLIDFSRDDLERDVMNKLFEG